MAGEDKAYCGWLRSLPCCMCGARPVQVHHRTGAGMARRAHDHEGMPLCHQCHTDLHGLTGKFKGWDKQRLRTWQREQVDICRDGWRLDYGAPY